jgi:hypothetical protein
MLHEASSDADGEHRTEDYVQGKVIPPDNSASSDAERYQQKDNAHGRHKPHEDQ